VYCKILHFLVCKRYRVVMFPTRYGIGRRTGARRLLTAICACSIMVFLCYNFWKMPLAQSEFYSLHHRRFTLPCYYTPDSKWLIATSQGVVCPREDIDSAAPFCCRNASTTIHGKDACKFCATDTKCCTGYEMCTACCLHQPSFDQLRTRQTLAARRYLQTVDISEPYSPFDVCRYACRTHSDSTFPHFMQTSDYGLGYSFGRTYYRSSFKYCFGHMAPPLSPSNDADSDQVVLALELRVAREI
jgi:hypothetical protein